MMTDDPRLKMLVPLEWTEAMSEEAFRFVSGFTDDKEKRALFVGILYLAWKPLLHAAIHEAETA